MFFAGLDAGSRAVKVAIYDSRTEEIVARGIIDQGVEQNALAKQVLLDVLDEIDMTQEDLHAVIATGYGRNLIDFAHSTITEITCHARGVQYLEPEVRTIIEIGGQDSKLIRLDKRGHVRDFAMNDRCAAGTGRFLEMVAQRIQCSVADLGEVASHASHPAVISSMCVVFAETEIIGLLASGASPADIIAGVQEAIARRMAGMAGRGLDSPVVFTGGVALVQGMRESLERIFDVPVIPSSQPQMTGAIGAALLAAERVE